MSGLSYARVCAVALLLLSNQVAGPVQARVGVTSATDGDPLGRPPGEAERVLRIGIDVQANEIVSTSASDRVHLVFLDGSSLTVGPNARLTLDRFVYDPARGTGELAVTLSQGLLRIVGGKISKVAPITVNTPSGVIGIRGGICLVEASASRTLSTFLFGVAMTVTGQGVQQRVTRTGSQIGVTVGAAPAAPVLLPQGGVAAQLGQLEGGGAPRAPAGTPAVDASSTVIVNGTRVLGSAQSAPSPAWAAAPSAAQIAAAQGASVTANNAAGINPAASNRAGAVPGPVGAVGIPAFSELPITGTAAYGGSFAAAGSNGAIITGTVALDWNFASCSGNFSAQGNGPTGHGTATAPVTLIPNTPAFTGPLTVRDLLGPVVGTGTVSGIFINSNGAPAGGVAGSMVGSSTAGGSFVGGFTATR